MPPVDGNKKGQCDLHGPSGVVAVSGQLVLLARTSPVTARQGKAVIKEAVKVRARDVGHACRIGPWDAIRQEARGSVCAMRDGLGRQWLPGAVSHPLTRATAHPRKKEDPRARVPGVSWCFDGDLRTVIQGRRVAAQLSATAERELAERSEALNSRLLVLHLLPPPEQGTWVYTKWCQDGLLGRRRANCQSCAWKLCPGERPERLKPHCNSSGVRSMKQDRAGAQHSGVSGSHCTYRSTSNRK